MSQISRILPTSLVYNNKVLSFETPIVMGILNVTPDSFFDGGKYNVDVDLAIKRAGEMINQGATIIDIGGASTRPGADIISSNDEWNRIQQSLVSIRKAFPSIWISVDTYNGQTAKLALDAGADMINDISAWEIDSSMLDVVAEFNCPYVLMHMQGRPDNMQKNPSYDDVAKEVAMFFQAKLPLLKGKGIKKIILDPGFGFGKSIQHNYTLLKKLDKFLSFGCPLLAGISRKSMVTRILNLPPEEALNGTTALHMLALLNGASILRVHDVKEAVECIQIYTNYLQA